MDELELWSNTTHSSPWVLSVWVSLQEKALPFTLRTVDLARAEQRSAPYAENSLTGRVPALRHGGFWVAESLAIAFYLEDLFPQRPMLPLEPRRRARDLQVLSWIRSDLVAVRVAMPFEGLVGVPRKSSASAEAEQQVEKLLRVSERLVPDRDPAVPLLADYDLAVMLRRLVRYGYDLSAHPGLARYCETLWSRPAVQRFLALDRPVTPES